MNTAIALVGRPNVGKSRLFNRLINKRVSIVHDQPGITRDVIAEDMDNGVVLMDTVGIGLSQDTEVISISHAVEEQVKFAIQAANVIFFVVDGKQGCMPIDIEISNLLRKSGKTIYIIVNKIDSDKDLPLIDQFHSLGLGDPMPISAEHGLGENALRQVINMYASDNINAEQKEQVIRVCLSGRPNVGKSSITNALLHDKRMIISDIPGTTRDAVAVTIPFIHQEQEYKFKLFDTAGLRERKKINNTIEFFSSLRSHQAIESSDIVYLVIDAMSGVTRQDKKLAGEVIRQGKAIILLVNKWDLAYTGIQDERISGYNNIVDFRNQFEDAVRQELFHLPKSPIVFLSAKTGFNISEILTSGVHMYQRLSKTISTGALNRAIQKLLQKQPPAVVSGKRFKIYYAVHSCTFPHTFKVFCNRFHRLSESYKRYLQNGLIEQFDLHGCPIQFIWNEKETRYQDIE